MTVSENCEMLINEISLKEYRLKNTEVEVLSYIEIFKQGLTNVKGYLAFIKSNFNMNALDFYSQSFKADMIEKYFIGYKRITEQFAEWTEYLNSDNEKINCVKQNNLIVYHNLMEERFGFVYPITLDNFISDCRRVGIKLIFKESEK